MANLPWHCFPPQTCVGCKVSPNNYSSLYRHSQTPQLPKAPYNATDNLTNPSISGEFNIEEFFNSSVQVAIIANAKVRQNSPWHCLPACTCVGCEVSLGITAVLHSYFSNTAIDERLSYCIATDNLMNLSVSGELNDTYEFKLVRAGGYGTLEELLEVIAWSQLRIHDKPVSRQQILLCCVFSRSVEQNY